MTPYAVLLVKPTDDDLTIRKRFHEISKTQHPDRTLTVGEEPGPGPLWYALTDAYQQVKTPSARREWHSRQVKLARLCGACSGCGVTWKRVGHDKGAVVCAICGGEGRVKR